ncbi:methionine/alanine import family NSS transporter small subunit [Glycomyces tritici]|uniref:Methionine/alanine import family NSS transporter small subunit n=1 Tax=Glycomyces tritici TaxID=2665176 RepID=A0ABT7YIW1_9ACTN|nr:methionine/alanine import family NSS transporter small subunit [Glycomyces tritici]MDN3238572.1 methionine/alanine import family NSS transporter small subunit [Glycomyces tritici]
MTPSAIAMMIVALVVVGGGLLVSIISLIRNPEQPED